MAPRPRTDEFLLRLLESHSERKALDVATRVKLIEAGIPAADHKPCRCWMRSNRGGYGCLWNGVRLENTHRLAYRLEVGPIPEGHDVLHHCDVPSCSEPTHLWTGTQADNNLDRDRKGRNGGHKLIGRKRGPSLQRGIKHKRAKLTEDQARSILRMAKEASVLTPDQMRNRESFNVSAYARELGVSESLVRGVISGRNWAWLDP